MKVQIILDLSKEECEALERIGSELYIPKPPKRESEAARKKRYRKIILRIIQDKIC